MASPSVLIAASHYWTSPFQVGGHHLARAFAARGWRVAFVSDPITPLHLASGVTDDLRARFSIYRAGGIDVPGSLIWAYVPGAVIAPHRGLALDRRFVQHVWHRLTVPNVRAKVRDHGFGAVDLLVLDSNIQGFWLDCVSHRRSVMRIGDRMSGFDSFTPEMDRARRRNVRRVDLVAYSASGLADEVASFQPRATLHLPNGIDLERFAASSAPAPADLDRIARPIAIYVGAMEKWFDFELMNAVTAAMPDVSFIFVGPDALARRRLAQRANVHLLGARPYDAIPDYLRNADVGLIPFDVQGHPDLVNSVHPLKLYEYIASGLPVVATRWEEIARLRSPALLRDDATGFIDGIRAALASPFDRDAARAFVEGASWSARASSLLEAVGLDPS